MTAREAARDAVMEARVSQARRAATVSALECVYSGAGVVEADALLDAFADLGWKVEPA